MEKNKYNILPTKAEWQQFLQNEPKFLFWDAIGSLIYAIGVITFIYNADFAPGGVTGLAMILNYLTHLPIGVLTILINVPIIFIAMRYLGTMYLVRTFQTILMNALFLDVIVPLFPTYPINGQVDTLFAAIFGGVVSGVGLAIIYRSGTCTGGSDFIIMSIKKVKPHVPVATITFIIDALIIFLGVIVYKDINALLYGLIYTVAYSIVIEKVLSGNTAGKVALIISDKNEAIMEELNKNMVIGGTFLHGEGAYTGKAKKVLLIACDNKKLSEIRRVVGVIDPTSITIIMTFAEARGQGFIPHYEEIMS